MKRIFYTGDEIRASVSDYGKQVEDMIDQLDAEAIEMRRQTVFRKNLARMPRELRQFMRVLVDEMTNRPGGDVKELKNRVCERLGIARCTYFRLREKSLKFFFGP